MKDNLLVDVTGHYNSELLQILQVPAWQWQRHICHQTITTITISPLCTILVSNIFVSILYFFDRIM